MKLHYYYFYYYQKYCNLVWELKDTYKSVIFVNISLSCLGVFANDSISLLSMFDKLGFDKNRFLCKTYDDDRNPNNLLYILYQKQRMEKP